MLANTKKGEVSPTQNTGSAIDFLSLYDRLKASATVSSVTEQSAALNKQLDEREKAFEKVFEQVQADIKRVQAQKQREQERVNDLLKLIGDL